MDATVRATCPACGTGLRIPAQWVGQAVKCKKCGSVVRSKPKDEGTGDSTPLPPQKGHAPAENAFDFSKPSEDDDHFPLPEPIAPPAANRDEFDPFGGNDEPQPQPAPIMPGYPYPMPPGYPAGYAPPPGYPYPLPGYPYPMPPGYGPPGGYPVPPGYPYPMPPGYGPPGGYPVPPGYPYPAPPGMMPPEAVNPAALPGAVPVPTTPGPQLPLNNAPVKPGGAAKPPAAAPSQPSPTAPRPVNQAAASAAQNPPRPKATPDPVPPSNEFKTETPVAAAPRRYRRGAGGKGKIVWIAICVFMTIGFVTAGIFGAKYVINNNKEKITDPTRLVDRLGHADPAEREAAAKALKEMGSSAEAALKVGSKSDNAEIAKKSSELLALITGTSGAGSGGQPKTTAFPRRLLFIHISKYMFLNPLTASEPGASDKTKWTALRLAGEWRVPADSGKDTNQLFLLSDTAAPDKIHGTDKGHTEKSLEIPVPMKSVVMGAYERFFETSRAQDRIVVYFGGHAVELDGKTYLVPVEGELEDVESLIPLEDFYTKLKACKATQKVVIWDVCRFNPDRGKQKLSGVSAMTETLAKSLAEAPPGVEVVTTCTVGENALEFNRIRPEDVRGAATFSGSSFLESAVYVAGKNKNAKTPSTSDPIPIPEWVGALAPRLITMAEHSPGEQKKQTLKLDGKLPGNLVAYNADEPPARRFEMPASPKGSSPGDIKNIEREFFVPPISPDGQEQSLAEYPFKEEIMKDFKSDISVNEIMNDKEKYRFQARVLETFQAVRELWARGGTTGNFELRQSIGKPDDKLKAEIAKEQEFWALGIAKLELASAELDGVAAMKESQSKRWQAHFEYARAVIRSRQAYMNEYNKLLGDVRTETLPALEKGQTQYNLVHSEKMKSKKDIQKLAEEAQESYKILIEQFKGTPWAIQAKREKSVALGLSWSPGVANDPNAMTPP